MDNVDATFPTKVTCTNCGSSKIDGLPGCLDVYQCRDCGEFFEDDAFDLQDVQRDRDRQTAKQMQEY